MKQLFTILTIFALSLVNAQVFSENFDSGVPGNLNETILNGNLSWSTCGGDTGGVACPISGSGSATFYHTSVSLYNTALVTPSLNLSSGVYSVNFTLAKKTKDNKTNEFYVEISTDGGQNWTLMREYLQEVATPTQFSIIMTPYSPTDNTLVRFRARNRGGHRLILDNVSVNQVTTDDIAIENFDIQSLFVAGATEIKGSLRNNGANTLTSFDLNWQVDGGTVHTQNYSGQNIASGQELNFVHSDLWDATGGSHNVKLWVSNTNVTDSNSANNEMTKTVLVASGIAYKRPMYEKFSSSTCPPCYGFNTNAFTPFWNDFGHDKATLISYQVNWPGAGDPYYTAEVGSRVSYYGINAAPTLLLNTVPGTFSTSAALQQALENMRAEDNLAFFKIESDHTVTGSNIEVQIDITPYLTGNYTVRAMVIEKVTTGNIANNGETEFHHVFMKALPNANGSPLSFVHDVPQSLTLTADLSTTNIEEMEDIAVVVFIQDNATKQILQSGYTDASGIVLGLNEQISSSHVSIVPNPTTGIVNIISKEDVQLQIFDLTGKSVFNQTKVAANSTLNLSKIGKGVFIVNILDKDGNKTIKKLIVK